MKSNPDETTLPPTDIQTSHARLEAAQTIDLLRLNVTRLQALYERYWGLGMETPEGVYAGHTYAEPYVRIALKAEHQLKQTLQLIAHLEAKGSSTHASPATEQNASLF